jgi:hypothetical protein
VEKAIPQASPQFHFLIKIKLDFPVI